MKNHLMLFTIAVQCLAATVAGRAEDFAIHMVIPMSRTAWVNDAWLNNTPCFKVTVSTGQEWRDPLPIAKAYLFDKDKTLLTAIKHPTDVALSAGETYRQPPIYKAGKRYDLYFGIPAQLRSGSTAWKYAVFVFGDGKTFVAEMHPKANLGDFTFPEADKIGAKSNNEAAPGNFHPTGLDSGPGAGSAK